MNFLQWIVVMLSLWGIGFWFLLHLFH